MTTPGNGSATPATHAPAPTETTRGAHLPNAGGFTKKQPKPPAAPTAKPVKKKPAPKRGG